MAGDQRSVPLKIESYSFGKITISRHTYSSDVIIYPDHVDPSWWREEGHRLSVMDLEMVLDAKPEVLIIGTGYLGALRVPEETQNVLREKGIAVIIERTGKAVELFNNLQKKERTVVAALHLTC